MCHAHSGVQLILRVVFVFVCVPYIASFFGLSIFDWHFGILLGLFTSISL